MEVHTSSLQQHKPGEWSTLSVRATNPTDEDQEALVAVLFEGGKRQFGRRMWVPARSDRSTWLPIAVPPEIPTESGSVEYSTLVFDAAADREILTRAEGEGLTSSSVLRISHDPVRSTFFLPKPLLSPTSAETQQRHDWPAALAAARSTRGLNTTSPEMVSDFLAPWHAAHRGWDTILLATDRLKNDTAGLATLRHWVHDGGRLWIALESVQPETLAAILGHDCGVEYVDRVALDRYTIHTRDRDNGMEASDDGDHEQPIEMVRVLTSHPDVPATVNGWPAAIWVRCGQGDVLLTTLGPRGWLAADGASSTDSLRILAARLLAGRPERLDAGRFQKSLEQQIGYATPSRLLAGSVLGAFCAALLGAGLLWGSRRCLDNLAWFVPAASLTAAALLGLVGAANSRRVAPTIAAATLLRLEPATGEALFDSNAAVFDQQTRPVAWAGRQRTWVLPDAAQGTNGERIVWLDDDVETTQNTTTHAGSVERLVIRGAGTIIPGLVVNGRFGPAGLEGRFEGGPVSNLRDPSIVGMPGPALAVQLAADGTFTAGSTSLMAPEQYNPAAILSDDARWRQETVRRLLLSPAQLLRESGRPRGQSPAGIEGVLALRRRPWFLGWCDFSADAGWDAPTGFAERSSILALAPLHFERTPAGSPFRIPPNFLPIRLGDGTQGRSNAFDLRRGEWVKGLTTPTTTQLRFLLPDSVLPCRLDSGQLTLRVNAPSRELEVGAFREGQPVSLLKVAEPNGTYQIDVGAAELALDAGGAVPITITVSATAKERAAVAKGEGSDFDSAMSDSSLSSTWDIEHVRLTVDGHTR